MADLSQTAANVTASTGASIGEVIYGESVTQGMPLYKNTTDGKWYQCDANDTAAKAVCGAIAATPGVTDGAGYVYLPGTLVNLGATLTLGVTYILSATKGAICPTTDLASASYLTVLGVPITTALMKFQPIVSGVQKP